MDETKPINDKWHKRYLNIAKDVASWSKDPSSKVGAVIVGKKGQIISQGYNGYPRGFKDNAEKVSREDKYKCTIHAEPNAIFNAALNGASTENTSIYVCNVAVCHECAKYIIQAGIKEVYYDTKPSGRWETSGLLALRFFDYAEVKHFYIGE